MFSEKYHVSIVGALVFLQFIFNNKIIPFFEYMRIYSSTLILMDFWDILRFTKAVLIILSLLTLLLGKWKLQKADPSASEVGSM